MPTSLERRNKLESQVIEKALKDDAFREQLVSNPKAVIEEDTGLSLPADLEIKVVQESANLMYLVLPPAPAAATPLSGADVANAADCSGWSSAAECTLECTQCGNNDTTCQPGPTEG